MTMENFPAAMTWWDKTIKALAAVGGAIAGLFGGFDTVLIVLAACMAIDYVSGLAAAWMGNSRKTESGHLDSKTGARGIAKKGLMLLVVLVGALLDRALGTEAAVFRNALIWFYIANEGLSILENLTLCGVPFPQKIRDALEQIRKKSNEEAENTRQE